MWIRQFIYSFDVVYKLSVVPSTENIDGKDCGCISR